MDLSYVFDQFRLNEVSNTWVDLVWNEDFCSEREVPIEYESVIEEIDILHIIRTSCDTFRIWFSNGDDSLESSNVSNRSSLQQKSWQVLVEKEVKHKHLIAILSLFIKKDIKELKTLSEVILAVEAARLYFILLSINGAHVFNVFNSSLYCQALDILKILKIVYCEKPSKQKEKKQSKSKTNQQANDDREDEDEERSRENDRRKKRKGQQQTGELDPEEDSDNTEVLSLNSSERDTLIKILAFVIEDLEVCLQNLELNREQDSVVRTVQNLINIVSLEKASTKDVSPQRNSLAYLAYKSCDILEKMCEPHFGNPHEIVRHIMKSILPYFCPSGQHLLNDSSSSSNANVHIENLLQFVYRLLSKIKDVSYDAVIAFLQQLCVRTPDKADIRSKCTHLIVSIMESVPKPIFNYLVVWIATLCFAEFVRNRLVGVEIFSLLLQSAFRHPNLYETFKSNNDLIIVEGSNNQSSLMNDHSNSSSKNDSNSSSQNDSNSYMYLRFIISVMVSKCTDVSSLVRTKSITTISALILSKNVPICLIMSDTFLDSCIQLNSNDKHTTADEKSFNFKSFIESIDFTVVNKNEDILKLNKNPIPEGSYIMWIMEKLSNDDKVFVKKAALTVICNVCLIFVTWITPQRIAILTRSCLDASLVVRKQMSTCLTELLLAYPRNNELVIAWVEGVFPLIGDNELKSQEKVIEITSKLIIDNMETYDESTTVLSKLPWKVVSLLYGDRRRKLLRIVCRYWASEKKIRTTELRILKSHLGTENNLSALFLLVCIAEYQDISETKQLLEYYYTKIEHAQETSEFESYLIMEALFLSLHELDGTNKEQLCESIKNSINSFSVPIHLISKSLGIYQRTYPVEMKSWSSKLIKGIEIYLNSTFKEDFIEDLNNDLICRYIFTLGDVTMTSPVPPSKDVVSILVGLIDIYNEENEIAVRWRDKVSSKILSSVVVTLGKLSIQNQRLSETIVPVFASLLDIRSASNIKINVLVALTDLCVRYTSQVELYLGDMCVCLKDEDVAVRKMTLTLLMQLIKEDYVKLRSQYFFYLLSMLDDNSEEIRLETEAFLINCAMIKQRNIMSTYFIQALYFFNDFEGQNQYSQIEQDSKEKLAFLICGSRNIEKRRNIYRFMLQNMQDDHRFRVTHKLSTDILSEAVEGNIDLDNKGSQMLEDALFCLACDEIRLVHMSHTKDLTDDGLAEINPEEIISNMCKRKVISQALKKDYVDVIIPIILNLKVKLREMKSPLQRDLIVALRELMKDFKDEINEILANDKEAADEIRMELRKISKGEDDTSELSTIPSQMYALCEKISEQVVEDYNLQTMVNNEIGLNSEQDNINNSNSVDIGTVTNTNTINATEHHHHIQDSLSTAYGDSSQSMVDSAPSTSSTTTVTSDNDNINKNKLKSKLGKKRRKR